MKMGRPPNNHASETLRGVVTLAYGLHQTNCSLHKFQATFVHHQRERPVGTTSSQLAYRWARGEVTPSETTVQALASAVPGIDNLYAHPMFYLLRDDRPDFDYSYSLLTNSLQGRDSNSASSSARSAHRLASSMRVSSENSALRVLDVFAIALAVLRGAEVHGAADHHLKMIAPLYSAVPLVATQPWFRVHWRLLRHCVMRVHGRCRASSLAWKANWTEIHQRTQACRLDDSKLGLHAKVLVPKFPDASEVVSQQSVNEAKVTDDPVVDAKSLLEPRWWQAFPVTPSVR